MNPTIEALAFDLLKVAYPMWKPLPNGETWVGAEEQAAFYNLATHIYAKLTQARNEALREAAEAVSLRKLELALDGQAKLISTAELSNVRNTILALSSEPVVDDGWKAMDSAPRDGTAVLLVWNWDSGLHKGTTVIMASWHCRKHSYFSSPHSCPANPGKDCEMGWGNYKGEFSAWMPLPPPPVSKSKE